MYCVEVEVEVEVEVVEGEVEVEVVEVKTCWSAHIALLTCRRRGYIVAAMPEMWARCIDRL